MADPYRSMSRHAVAKLQHRIRIWKRCRRCEAVNSSVYKDIMNFFRLRAVSPRKHSYYLKLRTCFGEARGNKIDPPTYPQTRRLREAQASLQISCGWRFWAPGTSCAPWGIGMSCEISGASIQASANSAENIRSEGVYEQVACAPLALRHSWTAKDIFKK